MKLSNLKLGIGIPLNFHMVPSDFVSSFIAMEKPPFVYLQSSRATMEEMRNALAYEAMSTRCTHLLMCDTDQWYPPDTVTRLLSHKQPVVGARIRRRYPPFDNLMFRGRIGAWTPVEEWTPGQLVEVDATGTGCILYEMSVFKRIRSPWFEVWKHEGKPVGEDFAFCSKLRDAGIPIYVDPDVYVQHLSQLRITDSFAAVYDKIAREQRSTT